jgi:hypothetical protein
LNSANQKSIPFKTFHIKTLHALNAPESQRCAGFGPI